jgi:general secretion pathway protein G
MFRRLSQRSGFTLVELLIVVIILGVLAAIAIPQFSENTEDARVASLDTTLAEMRNAIEVYFHQHGSAYPGAKDSANGNASATAAVAATSFVEQMMKYSSVTGQTANVKNATFRYGPYLKKGMPANPYNNLNTIVCDITQDDITAVASGGSAGWKFYLITGRLIADDGAHDTN